jgi:hypothetical protein
MEELEKLVDKHGVENVVEMLADICWGKVDHIQVNWQDEVLAKYWRKCAREIARIDLRY